MTSDVSEIKMYLTRLEESGPHHYGPCPSPDHSTCISRWLESFGHTCSLCGKRFLIYDSLYGNLCFFSEEPSGGVIKGKILAIACNDCCPDSFSAMREHNNKPWLTRLFSKPNYKLENIEALKEIARSNQ